MTDEIKHILEHHINTLTRLHDRLADNGEPLDASDKQLLRSTVASSWLRGLQQEQRYMFDNGDVGYLEQNFNNIMDMLNSLI
jgi:hypothetical protein